ncbi:adhesion G-protein coupled receptor F3 [Chaetodon auriga]|uniref:adhesion G-protein coupled receptor F3 n=1 Tax=Chaetodon auriga TaxID=39042 RepID=UPI004032ED34
MWIFILLYIVGLNTSQASGNGNSTQMYYAKLTIENSAIKNITKVLTSFVSSPMVIIDNLTTTTTCQNVSTRTECTCEQHHRWSDKVCKSNQECCGNKTCTFPTNSSRMCVSDTAVTVTGSITLKDNNLGCLSEKNSEPYQVCNNEVLKEMKMVYSTLRGFDILRITNYRTGSIIADFEMTIAYSIKPHILIKKSLILSDNLQRAVLVLDTRGIVHMSVPQNPVCYNSQYDLKCTLQEDLKTQPVWQLARNNKVFDITNGTESQVTMQPMETKVALRNISKMWAGEYTCVYNQKADFYTISHKASFKMNVSLLPDIGISMAPSFPHCRKSSDLLTVRVQCEIEKSDENYTVTWDGRGNLSAIKVMPNNSTERTCTYAAEMIVGCNSTAHTPQITCSLRNRCNQQRNASASINIIYENDQFCAVEDDWEDTKAGFTAVLQCKNMAGQIQRKCHEGSEKATWGSEVSTCVSQEVNIVLQQANIVDTGLGSLDGNAAHVFSLLKNVTNNSQTINTFANINASVQVLSALSERQQLQPNESTAVDFLESSSNLLEKSLNKSWETKADDGNISLAERYLSSVEQLIKMADIKDVPKQKNIEVAASNCSQGSQCVNKVFDVTIHLNISEAGSVKTAGFKQLENYLPNNDDKYKPNSIVVSTTAESNQSDSVEIKITFQLLKPRPRNVDIRCVSWDNNTRGWSESGCRWDGPSNEGRCICSHLSSFAVLMSRYPLNVPGITEITYIGLSVSIMSLVVSLVIELIVWRAVVKTNMLYLRHTAHVNISICLLVADCCFLASSKPANILVIWCKTFTVLKHFCYLSMFFWMLCLSTMLLHQAIFLFHTVSKKNFLRFSFVLGYVCPLLIVTITFLASKGGAEGLYFSKETCWLVYTGLMSGSILAFVIPVGIIVFINVISMLVVIMKLLDHPKIAESSREKERKAAITVIRSVVLLTPVFGVTWMLGFAVLLLDLTTGDIALVANYAFILLNGFQGLFILLATCLADKLTRDALLNRLKKSVPTLTNHSSTMLESIWKK